MFCNHYATRDEAGVRDYRHVMGVATDYVNALQKFEPGSGVSIYNLGTGIGYSVLDVLHAYEQVCGYELPYRICDRRSGDIATSYCGRPKQKMSWAGCKANPAGLCADSWRWQSMNPDGYRTKNEIA